MLKSRKMSKTIKRLSILFISIFVITSICGFSKAGWDDTLYVYENNLPNIEMTEAITPHRPKEDDTSAYAYNDKSNTGIQRVFVLGPGAMDLTYGSYKDLPIGQAYYFPNLVWESGYRTAALMFWPNYGKYGMYLHVWWSPDSI